MKARARSKCRGSDSSDSLGHPSRALVLILPILLLFVLVAGTAALPADRPAGAQTKSSQGATGSPPAATLLPAAVPASGIRESILTVSNFGRYAILVKSQQGVALRLVDRMSGPGPFSGKSGETDGRMDAFLGPGEYRIVTDGHPKAQGEATLEVLPFVERSPEPPVRLIERKLVESTLDDLEQISYWLEMKAPGVAILETAGRNLAALELWRDGGWIEPTQPQSETREVRKGELLRVVRMGVRLSQGWYRVTAYGGLSVPWAGESNAHPFYLRSSFPSLARVARGRHETSPLGIDRWLVPREVSYVRLELPERGTAALTVADTDDDHPFGGEPNEASITPESATPAAELILPATSARDRLITVTAPPGAPYVLQHFPRYASEPLRGEGRTWLSTVHSGSPADNADATAALARWTADAQGVERPALVQAQAVEIDTARGWARRFNLLGRLVLLLHVSTADTYEVLSRGVEARFQLTPFTLPGPRSPDAQPLKPVSPPWQLSPGYYELAISPAGKGILEAAIRPSKLKALDLDGLLEDPSNPPLRPGVLLPEVVLEKDHPFPLTLNLAPGVQTGLVLRSLPLDLTDPLPLYLSPGDAVPAIPFRANVPGRLAAGGEDGSAFEVSLDGGSWQPSIEVPPGLHTARARHSGASAVLCSLALEPKQPEAAPPLPATTSALVASFPELPVVEEGRPQLFDLERNEKLGFLLHAAKPGLYRVESTGLLQTEGTIGTRTQPSLFKDSASGDGRNFLIQRYLREGDYLVTVAAKGSSAGHLGLALTRTPVREGGDLEEGRAARVTLGAGEAVGYRFSIEKEGEFALRAMSMNRPLPFRLEDADGWPLDSPTLLESITRHFSPGAYRIVLLPAAIETRRVTFLDRIEPPARFEGHGPHALPLDTRAEGTWREPKTGERREPDVWEIAIPAPTVATITLTGEMQADLERLETQGEAGGESWTRVGLVPPGRPWARNLPRGRYRLAAVCSRRNDWVKYEVSVSPYALVSGLSRKVQLPAKIPVSVGEESLVEIGSFGTVDVRARLVDKDADFVASNDDRPNDWNFQIARSLPAGSYELRVDSVSGASGETTVGMKALPEVRKDPLPLPFSGDVEPGDGVLVYPIESLGGADFLAVSAEASGTVGCSLEEQGDGERWRTAGTSVGSLDRIALPLAQTRGYRLRVWFVERRGDRVKLRVVATSLETRAESALERGIRLVPLAGIEPPIGVAAVSLDRPGVFRLEPEEGGSRLPRWSSLQGEPCEEADSRLIPAHGSKLWFAADLRGDGGGAEVRAERVHLAAGAEKAIQLRLHRRAEALCDLETGKRGPVLAIATSTTGRPGLRLVEESEPSITADARFMAAGPRSAAAVCLSGPCRAYLWQAEKDEPVERFDVRLHHVEFPESSREPAAWGLASGTFEGTAARQLTLPPGPKQLTLTLGEATVAALVIGVDTVESVHWQGGTPFTETVETGADSLILLHAREEADRYALELLPRAEGSREAIVTHGTPYEAMRPAAGTLRLTVKCNPEEGDRGRKPATLHVRGSVRDAWLLSDRGGVEIGRDFPLDCREAALLVPHDSGIVLAWIDRPGEERLALWKDSAAGAPSDLTPPANIPLSGPAKLFRVTLALPAVLHVRSQSPVVTQIERPERPPEVEVHEQGALVDAYLPAGSTTIGLRALIGGALWGTAEIAISGVTIIGEGLGPEVLLPPGASRFYAFTTTREGPVGIGVHADSDAVQCTLLDGAGRTLGTGLVQMPTLKPGDYLFAVHVPEDGSPVRARPALAGVDRPDTGPPAEIIQRYLEVAREKSLAPVEVPKPAPAPAATVIPGDEDDETGESFEGSEDDEGEPGYEDADEDEPSEEGVVEE